MGMFLGNDDTTNAKEYGVYELLPPGQYVAQIIDGEAKKTQAGDDMVTLTWIVLEGEHSGKTVFDTLMVTGNPKAIEMRNEKKKAMGKAMNIPNPYSYEDIGDILQKPCIIEVCHKAGTNGTIFANIKRYLPLNSQAGDPFAALPPEAPTAYQAPPPQQNTPPPQAAPAQTPPPAYQAPQAQTPPPQAPPWEQPKGAVA